MAEIVRQVRCRRSDRTAGSISAEWQARNTVTDCANGTNTDPKYNTMILIV